MILYIWYDTTCNTEVYRPGRIRYLCGSFYKDRDVSAICAAWTWYCTSDMIWCAIPRFIDREVSGICAVIFIKTGTYPVFVYIYKLFTHQSFHFCEVQICFSRTVQYNAQFIIRKTFYREEKPIGEDCQMLKGIRWMVKIVLLMKACIESSQQDWCKVQIFTDNTRQRNILTRRPIESYQLEEM